MQGLVDQYLLGRSGVDDSQLEWRGIDIIGPPPAKYQFGWAWNALKEVVSLVITELPLLNRSQALSYAPITLKVVIGPPSPSVRGTFSLELSEEASSFVSCRLALPHVDVGKIVRSHRATTLQVA